MTERLVEKEISLPLELTGDLRPVWAAVGLSFFLCEWLGNGVCLGNNQMLGLVLLWVLLCSLHFIEGGKLRKKWEWKTGWGSCLSKGIWRKLKLTKGVFERKFCGGGFNVTLSSVCSWNSVKLTLFMNIFGLGFFYPPLNVVKQISRQVQNQRVLIRFFWL